MQDRREGIRCEVRITLQGAVEVEVEMCIEFWAFWAYMAKRTRGFTVFVLWLEHWHVIAHVLS